MTHIFKTLGLPAFPVLLAPLAGVSDHPFRRICSREGASLTYVEMLSATALLYKSKRTFEMLKRHPEETKLGVQLTGKSAEEVAQAVAVLTQYPFETIDINMGCPVHKVTKAGCGSAILKDPQRVCETVRLARNETDKPLSAKIRIGWDRNQVNYAENASAVEAGGADFLTVHGRLRSDDYAAPVDLEAIAAIKKAVKIPVIGNGNIFSAEDAHYMRQATGVDGVMVSRGALGNPWIFRDLTAGPSPTFLAAWLQVILDHLAWQQDEYGGHGNGAVCMRKHLLWYAKGWPGVKKLREQINVTENIASLVDLLRDFAAELNAMGCTERQPLMSGALAASERFHWDPKYEMDRQLDRGVGDDALILGSAETLCAPI